MAIQDTDSLLVNRNGTNYRQAASNIMTIQDSDLLLVNRGGTNYKATGLEVKDFIGVDPANPAPSDFTAVPPFDGGNGTLSNPYIITPSECYKGGRATSVQLITVANQAPGKTVIFSDLNKSTNGIRFVQPAWGIQGDGKATFRLVFNDSPATSSGAIYTGLLKCGTTYFKWVVTVLSYGYDDLPLTGPSGAPYNIETNNITGGTATPIGTNMGTDWLPSPLTVATSFGGQASIWYLKLKSNGKLAYRKTTDTTGAWTELTFSGNSNFVWSGLAAGNTASGGIGGYLYPMLKNDGSAAIWATYYSGSLSSPNVSKAFDIPGTLKTAHTGSIPETSVKRCVIATNTTGSVYLVAISDANSSLYQPSVGNVPGSGSNTLRPVITSPLNNGEKVIDAWPTGRSVAGSNENFVVILTDAGNIYTTQGSSNNQNPKLVGGGGQFVGVTAIYDGGNTNQNTQSIGALSRSGELWGFSSSASSPLSGAFGLDIPFRKLDTDEGLTFVSPPYMYPIYRNQWWALESSGEWYGAEGSAQPVRFNPQPPKLFNARQTAYGVIL